MDRVEELTRKDADGLEDEAGSHEESKDEWPVREDPRR
jgi:hypothetical protein